MAIWCKFASGHSIILCKDEAQKEFVIGIQWLFKAVEVLCKAEINTTTPAKTAKVIAQNLRLPICQAHTHLNTALNFWESEKARQCGETERLVSSISSLKNNLCQQLKREEKEKQITGQRLRDQERQLQDLQMAQQRSIKLSDKLMRTCHVMTKIWGKSQVLKNEARRAFSLEPLLTPMKELVDMFTPEEQKMIKQSTFLLSKEIDFSSITWKLKAVCDANADSSIMAILDEYC